MAFDLFIAGILLITTIRGAAKGVAWQLAGIGALVLCFLFATPLSLAVAPMIKLAPPLNRWVAMLGIYLVFSFGTFAIARGFREALEKAKFVEFDRHMGALFGLAKGAILALVITFFSVAMSEKAREYILKTYTGYASAHIMDALHPVMPKELHAILEPYIHELDAVDPDLKRRHDEHHDEIGLSGDPQPDATPQKGGGYRPIADDETNQAGEGDELTRDPFQNDPNDTEAPPYTGNRPRQPAAEQPSLAEEAQQLLEQIPELAQQIGPAVRQQVLKALQNTLSEHRDELVDELSKAATPEKVSSIARVWQNGRPRRPAAADPMSDEDPSFDPLETRPGRSPNRPSAQEVADVDLEPKRQELLQGIAEIFSSQPSQQAKKMTEIETRLLGLPATVAVGVLDDWLSDLRGEDPDPDPQTDVATQLNVRIARQVDQQQIPRNRLPQDWQTRLERYLRN